MFRLPAFLPCCCVLGYGLVVAALWVCLMTGGPVFHGLLPLGAAVMPFDGVHFLQGVLMALAGMALTAWAELSLSLFNDGLS